MKKHKSDEIDQQWFDEQLGAAINRFDAVHEPLLPELHNIEQLVQLHKNDLKRKLWKDLLLFWLVACFIFGSMMWMLERDWVWFAILQSIIAMGGIAFVSMTFGKRMGRKWNN